MAGRGRGSASSFTAEQRTALGLNVRDAHIVPLAPPPLYGKLEAKPGALPEDEETQYLVSLKQRLTKVLHAKQMDNMEKWWPYMPPELTPTHNLKNIKKAKKRKLPKEDIETKLSALEKNEEKQGNTNESEKDSGKPTENKQEEELEEGEEFEDDNEMDEGTDYADNYFDNGEGFEDDEENQDDNDDGPIF